MNLRFLLFLRLLLVALLLGSECCSIAQCFEQRSTDAQHDIAPSVSSGLTFGMPQIVLRGRADLPVRAETSSPLPQDTGHLALSARLFGTAAKCPDSQTPLDVGPLPTEPTLVLQHTRLQI